jgi:uncharacterized membrane protein
MVMLIAGVVLWSIVHLLPSLSPARRQAIIDRRGEKVYKAAFAICIFGALALMIFGWRSTIPVFLYQVPMGLVHFAMLLVVIAFIIFGASNYPTRIKNYIRHPQLTGVLTWAVAHLIINGDSRSMVLFGGMAIWAILSIALINRRDGEWVKPEVAGWGREIRGLVISLIIAGVVIALHPYIAGRPII